MTRIGRRLIEDFLLPALNNEKYGDLLKWVDRDRQQFTIRWSHKNAAKWSLTDTEVFQDWDRLKGHYHPEIKGYYMQAKQRFRAALYKLNSVRKLTCEDKHVKKYQLILDHERRRDIMAKPKVRLLAKREDNQRSIPTSVIRKNTSYIERPSSMYMKEEMEDPSMSPTPSPASPTCSDSDDMAEPDDEDAQKALYEYNLAQRKHMRNSQKSAYSAVESPIKETCDILRENAMGQRVPHVPIQPVPTYSGSVNKLYDSSQQRVESPRVLLVKTFNDETNDEFVILQDGEPAHYTMDCIMSEEPDIALNLSVKSDDSETLSR